MIYLDHAAASPPRKEVAAAMQNLIADFGNPSSLHKLGLAAEKEVNRAREIIANAIGARPDEILFTSGGTEANNLAIFGGVKRHVGDCVVTSAAEHPSVIEPVKKLQQNGYKMFHVEHFCCGQIDLGKMKDVLQNPVCLVSISHVNSETGVIQDVAAIGRLTKQINPQILFHVDAVQSFCKIPVLVGDGHIDLLSLSAHKIGGLKGCGALFVRKGVSVKPVIFGGGQEGGLRSGTENTLGIRAFGLAVLAKRDGSRVAALRDRFLKQIIGAGGISINGENAVPHIVNISVEGVRPEVLLNAMSAKGVCISAGAACSASKRKKDEESAVLRAYGLDGERARTALRISFSDENTPDEMDAAAKYFVESVDYLRKTRVLR